MFIPETGHQVDTNVNSHLASPNVMHVKLTLEFVFGKT